MISKIHQLAIEQNPQNLEFFLSKLLTEGENLETCLRLVDSEGKTALYLAVEAGLEDNVEILASHK